MAGFITESVVSVSDVEFSGKKFICCFLYLRSISLSNSVLHMDYFYGIQPWYFSYSLKEK